MTLADLKAEYVKQNPKSAALFERAQAALPAGNTRTGAESMYRPCCRLASCPVHVVLAGPLATGQAKYSGRRPRRAAAAAAAAGLRRFVP